MCIEVLDNIDTTTICCVLCLHSFILGENAYFIGDYLGKLHVSLDNSLGKPRSSLAPPLRNSKFLWKLTGENCTSCRYSHCTSCRSQISFCEVRLLSCVMLRWEVSEGLAKPSRRRGVCPAIWEVARVSGSSLVSVCRSRRGDLISRGRTERADVLSDVFRVLLLMCSMVSRQCSTWTNTRRNCREERL